MKNHHVLNIILKNNYRANFTLSASTSETNFVFSI